MLVIHINILYSIQVKFMYAKHISGIILSDKGVVCLKLYYYLTSQETRINPRLLENLENMFTNEHIRQHIEMDYTQ